MIGLLAELAKEGVMATYMDLYECHVCEDGLQAYENDNQVCWCCGCQYKPKAYTTPINNKSEYTLVRGLFGIGVAQDRKMGVDI